MLQPRITANQLHSWDDWVLEDRLRKATEENRELAANLRREVETSTRRNAKTNKNKRALSDRDSVRDSEERGSSVPGRGNKRAKGENDIEKVSRFQLQIFFLVPAVFSLYLGLHLSISLHLLLSPFNALTTTSHPIQLTAHFHIPSWHASNALRVVPITHSIFLK